MVTLWPAWQVVYQWPVHGPWIRLQPSVSLVSIIVAFAISRNLLATSRKKTMKTWGFLYWFLMRMFKNETVECMSCVSFAASEIGLVQSRRWWNYRWVLLLAFSCCFMVTSFRCNAVSPVRKSRLFANRLKMRRSILHCFILMKRKDDLEFYPK